MTYQNNFYENVTVYLEFGSSYISSLAKNTLRFGGLALVVAPLIMGSLAQGGCTRTQKISVTKGASSTTTTTTTTTVPKKIISEGDGVGGQDGGLGEEGPGGQGGSGGGRGGEGTGAR